MNKIIIAVLVFITISCSTQQISANVSQNESNNTFSYNINVIANQLIDGLNNGGYKRIAILTFYDIDNNQTNLSKLLVEELTTKLFMTKKFVLIERNLINSLLEEQSMNLSGNIDEETSVSIGKILGVEAVVVGTTILLNDGIKVNARLISAETGELISVASSSLPKNNQLTTMLSTITNKSTVSSISHNSTIKSGSSNSDFYFEDFSSTEEGMLPSNWIGGSTLMVKKVNAKSVLSTFKGKKHNFTIPEVNFPENFKLSFYLKNNDNDLKITVGNLSFGVSQLNGNKFHSSQSNELFILELVKDKSIFKVFINGKEKKMIRFSEFKHDNTIEFKSSNCYIDKIVGKYM